jgi:hypothetical protein
MADVERKGEQMPWGAAGEVTERIIEAGDSAWADNVQISLNRGYCRMRCSSSRSAVSSDVLPTLQAHQIVRVPLAEEVPA